MTFPTGQSVLISGVGGLGHLAVQYARALGFRVGAVDPSEEKRELALRLGAQVAFDPVDDDIGETIATWGNGGPQTVLVTALASSAFADASDWVRPGSCVVFIGPPSADCERIGLSIAQIPTFEQTVRGSNVGPGRICVRRLPFFCVARSARRLPLFASTNFPPRWTGCVPVRSPAGWW